jgi:hypothetical protein
MHYDTAIRRHHVKSTAVRTMGYDENEWVLQVEFSNGKLYNYFRVPPHEYRSLLEAGSKGEYVNRQIKPYYEYEELE